MYTSLADSYLVMVAGCVMLGVVVLFEGGALVSLFLKTRCWDAVPGISFKRFCWGLLPWRFAVSNPPRSGESPFEDWRPFLGSPFLF